ncbi:MAG: Crp/Fnr family transcriptional regulator [Atopobiaceae bacterium]|jgi:CRP-like cAMP-binding protein|nr:Crp/Fnr family transcriptional regulator [Atopobiaceae bacterium]
MKNHTYGKNEVIFREGQFALSMYQVVVGSVGIYGNYDTENSQHIATLGPGEYFGEMGLAECYPRSATAVALEENTQVDEISSDEFATYFNDKPETVLAIMRSLSTRLRDTNERYREAQRAVYDAIEAENAGKKKSASLVARLTSMMFSARRARG